MIFIFQLFEGLVRDFFISLDGIHLFICLELAALFFNRALKDRRTFKVNLGWGIVFLCFGILVFSNIIRFFYLTSSLMISDPSFTIFGLFAVLSILAMLEYFIQKYLKTRYVFTLSGFIIASINLFIPIPVLITVIYWLALLIFAILFFKTLINLSSGTVRNNVILFTISFFSLMVGNVMHSQILMQNLRNRGQDLVILGLLGRLIQIVSLILMASVLFKLPIFFEVNWRENLIQIFIINKEKVYL